MDRRAVAGRSHVQLAGIGFGVGDELGDIVGRNGRVDVQHVRHARDAGDRREITLQIELEVIKERRVDRVDGSHEKQRVTVGRRARDRFTGEIAGCAGPILDDHRLADPVGHLLRDQARHDVGRAAGGKAQDQPYRTARIGLRMGRAKDR
jgi:hypothetical protein